ncbi:MAG: hypothetical protein OEY16_01780 [Alphaproteobacteria bacterium]|nr:hypothetical protein [Alphaproteobacteria bacterium]
MEQEENSVPGMMGHNAGNITVKVEVRLFNSLTRYAGDGLKPVSMELPAGSSVGDVLREMKIPGSKVHLALLNGRDITSSLYAAVNENAMLDEGDVLGLSGPVPYSWGYGSPVV